MYKLIKTIFIFFHLLWFQACVSEHGVFINVSEVNLDNIPQRSELRIDDVAIHSKERLYICEKEKRVYSVLTHISEVKEIKPTVIKEGKIWVPMAITTDDEKLYVAGYYLLSIFDLSGNLIHEFDTEIMIPTSIEVTKNGTIYIAGDKEGHVLHRYDENRVRKPLLKGFTHEDRAVVYNFAGGIISKWKEGIVFGAKTPYELVMVDRSGNITERVARPELDFVPKFKIERDEERRSVSFHNNQIGKGRSVVATDALVFYGYSLLLPKSAKYIDIYEHPLIPVAKNIQIDAIILGADEEGYLYFKRKEEGRERLFRGKFNESKFSEI